MEEYRTRLSRKIKASLELGKRIQELPFQEKASCNSSKKAYNNLFSVLSYQNKKNFGYCI
jgi:hypothetical protein